MTKDIINTMIENLAYDLETMKKYQELSNKAEEKLEELIDAGKVDLRLEHEMDVYYQKEMAAYISAAGMIVNITAGRIDEKTARMMIKKFGDRVLEIARMAA